MSWKRQQAALSSVQMTLNQEEQLVYSKTGPLEQKLKEWADQLIVLYVRKGQSKVLRLGKTFLLEGFSSLRKNPCSSLPTSQQLCCWQQFPVAWLSGEHLCREGPGRQQLYMSQSVPWQQRKPSASCINRSSMNRSTANRLRQALIPLYLALIKSHWEYPVVFWFPQDKKNTELEWGQQRAKKVRAWSMCSVRRCWGNWACLTWRWEGLGGLIWCSSSFPVPPSRLLGTAASLCMMVGQEKTDIKCNKGSSDLI